MARPEGSVDLDEMALLIAAHANPRLDVAVEQASLDALARAMPYTHAGWPQSPSLRSTRASRVTRASYHDPRNSYLDEVVRRRRGIPISLAVLTISVGRRLGVPLRGVGMPGHFLVGDEVDNNVFLDGFNGGVLIDTAGCERLFRSLQGAETPVPSLVPPAGRRPRHRRADAGESPGDLRVAARRHQPGLGPAPAGDDPRGHRSQSGPSWPRRSWPVATSAAQRTCWPISPPRSTTPSPRPAWPSVPTRPAHGCN